MERKFWRLLCSISDIFVYICVIVGIALSFYLSGYIVFEAFKSVIGILPIM